MSLVEGGIGKIGLFKTSPRKIGMGEIQVSEMDSAEIGSTEIKWAVHSAEIKWLVGDAEVKRVFGSVEIKRALSVQELPAIPGVAGIFLYSREENSQMFGVSHRKPFFLSND